MFLIIQESYCDKLDELFKKKNKKKILKALSIAYTIYKYTRPKKAIKIVPFPIPFLLPIEWEQPPGKFN